MRVRLLTPSLLLLLLPLRGADSNEVEIAAKGGIGPIIEAARSGDLELESQAARALRNLSVCEENKAISERGKGTGGGGPLARDDALAAPHWQSGPWGVSRSCSRSRPPRATA